MTRRLLMLAIFLSCSAFVLPTEAQDAAKPAAKPATDYRKVVQGLVSPNKALNITNYPETIAIPPNYDWKIQATIEKNRELLFAHCDEALPFLIEACADPRYSLVSQWSEDDDYYTWSVGRVCSEIIARHVEVFRDSMLFTLERYHQFHFVPLPRSASEAESKEIQAWWRERKSLSLRGLQLAGFDWAIAKVRQELKEKPQDEDREEELKSLVSARDELSRRHEALPGGRMWQSLLSPPKDYAVLPWVDSGEFRAQSFQRSPNKPPPNR